MTGGGGVPERLPSMSLHRSERGGAVASAERPIHDLGPRMPGFFRLAAGRAQALFFANDGDLSARLRATWNVRIILWTFTSIEHAVVTHDAHDAMTNSVGLGRVLWFKLLSGVAVAPAGQQCKFSRIVDA